MGRAPWLGVFWLEYIVTKPSRDIQAEHADYFRQQKRGDEASMCSRF
jgi:hypothetical protein